MHGADIVRALPALEPPCKAWSGNQREGAGGGW